MSNIWSKFEVLEQTSEAETAIIKIIDEKWKGVEYYYSTISIEEDKDKDDIGILSFEYHITNSPNEFVLEELLDDDKSDFETMIGDILVALIEQRIQDEETDESGTDDTE